MEITNFERIENKIITLRSEKVIIDADLALLYGVETRDINKAVKNNPNKFPNGYIFELTKDEKAEVVENFHHLEFLKYSPNNPKAFTEKGLYMIATILKSEKATETTISIIETYSKIKNLTRNINNIISIDNEKKRKNLIQKSGEIFNELMEDNLHIEDTETSIELNFAILKVKHTVKRKK